MLLLRLVRGEVGALCVIFTFPFVFSTPYIFCLNLCLVVINLRWEIAVPPPPFLLQPDRRAAGSLTGRQLVVPPPGQQCWGGLWASLLMCPLQPVSRGFLFTHIREPLDGLGFSVNSAVSLQESSQIATEQTKSGY